MAIHIPKYIQVRDSIQADIRDGKYKPGDKLPIREELIKHYSVTRTTLDKALRELIETGVLNASRKRGTFVSEKSPARSVAIISSMKDPYNSTSSGNDLAKMISTIISEGQDQKLSFFIPDDIKPKLSILHDYDAVVWSQPDDDIPPQLTGLNDKLIITNRYSDQFNYISTHHRGCIRDVTELLLTNSPENAQVFYLNPTSECSLIKERREGFIEACATFQRFYRICDLILGDFEQNLAVLTQQDIDPDKPVIMVSCTCNFTGAVLAFSREKNLTLYKDFFYSDVDNYHSLQATGHKIITILQDYKQMGKGVIEALQNNSISGLQTFTPHQITNTDVLGC